MYAVQEVCNDTEEWDQNALQTPVLDLCEIISRKKDKLLSNPQADWSIPSRLPSEVKKKL